MYRFFPVLGQNHSFWCNCKQNYFLNFSFWMFIICVTETTDFYVLILYLSTLLNWLTSSKFFGRVCVMWSDMPVNRHFYFLLSILDALVSFLPDFSSQDFQGRAESSVDSEPLCRVSGMRKAFGFSPLSLTLAVDSSYTAFATLGYTPSILASLTVLP